MYAPISLWYSWCHTAENNIEIIKINLGTPHISHVEVVVDTFFCLNRSKSQHYISMNSVLINCARWNPKARVLSCSHGHPPGPAKFQHDWYCLLFLLCIHRLSNLFLWYRMVFVLFISCIIAQFTGNSYKTSLCVRLSFESGVNTRYIIIVLKRI